MSTFEFKNKIIYFENNLRFQDAFTPNCDLLILSQQQQMTLNLSLKVNFFISFQKYYLK